EESQTVHRVQDAPLGGLQPVAGIRKSPRHDDRHGVIEKLFRHLLCHIDRFDFFIGVNWHLKSPSHFSDRPSSLDGLQSGPENQANRKSKIGRQKSRWMPL